MSSKFFNETSIVNKKISETDLLKQEIIKMGNEIANLQAAVKLLADEGSKELSLLGDNVNTMNDSIKLLDMAQ